MGPEFSKTIDLETAGGVIDRDTIKWWLKQSREAQSAIMTDEIPLDDALLQLREFIDENSGEFLFRSGKWSQLRQHNFAPFIRTAGDPARGVTTTIAMYAQSLSWESHRLRCQNGYSIRR